MMMSNSPVALITGAAKRLGARIARTLHAEGYKIIIHYRKSKTEAQRLCDELNKYRSDSAMIVEADLDHFEQLKKLIEVATSNGRLDVLVNNASEFFATPLGEVDVGNWERLMNSNLKAPYFLSQYALPHLKKSRGSIVNIADIHGQVPLKEYPIYSIAKAGLIMMTKTLAKEFGPYVRVNAVAPGITMWGEKNSMDDDFKQELINRSALENLVSPLDIAAGVLFLIRQTSMTGQVINIDCGRLLRN